MKGIDKLLKSKVGGKEVDVRRREVKGNATKRTSGIDGNMFAKTLITKRMHTRKCFGLSESVPTNGTSHLLSELFQVRWRERCFRLLVSFFFFLHVVSRYREIEETRGNSLYITSHQNTT
jgi:hypothetical protein